MEEDSSLCIGMGLAYGFSQASQCSFGCFEWKGGTYRNYTTRSTISHRNQGSISSLLAISNKELLPEGSTHTRPLQITIGCMGAKVPMVLIDNGPALNVCPFRIALTIGLDIETIIPSPLTIRAYDNTSMKVMGTFKAPCKIGPIEIVVEFHVMDITPNYNLLLGRAWLHPIGAITFSLHQR